MTTLTPKDFERILRKFADDPEDVMVDHETIVCQINGEDISVELSVNDDDILYCQEDGGRKMKAKQWIEKRLAGLDELADKILQYVPQDPHFISVSSRQTSVNNEDAPIFDHTAEAIYNVLNQKNPYATDAIYLLSEAGDGKTYIMDHLATEVAKKYKSGEVHYLFLPVGLDGRPFLRIDDLVIGILANKYRFRKYYFDAIIELINLGLLVLGLDGFEEMVVEGKEDDVISSLGELLTQMDSNGKLVISARRAFYDYALKNQTPLINAIRNLEVDFSAFNLLPWGKDEFCNLLATYRFDKNKQENIYDSLSSRMGNDHPILTRPVLAHKLVDLLSENGGDWRCITEHFDANKNPQAVIEQFVTLFLHREASQKWLLTGKQLLSTDQHSVFLQDLAEEMWLSNIEYVKEDYLQTLMEMFCEQQKLSPAYAKDCCEKVIHHAMLYKDGKKFFFCHEAFRQYFLGKRIAQNIINNRYDNSLVNMLSQNVLHNSAVDAIAYSLVNKKINYSNLINNLDQLKGGRSKISPMSQNIGGILLAYWKESDEHESYVFSDLFFSASSLKSCKLKKIHFIDCIIEELDAVNGILEDVTFENCSISSLRLRDFATATIKCTFDIQSIPTHLHDFEHDEDEYSPNQITALLSKFGAHYTNIESESTFDADQKDEIFWAFCKIVKLLYRRTGISGSLLALKFGEKWHIVKKEYIPIYLEKELLIPTNWQGQGMDTRYKLGIRMDNFENAQRNCNGSFEEFVKFIK